MADIVSSSAAHINSKSSADFSTTGPGNRRPSFKRKSTLRPLSSGQLLGSSRIAVQEVVVPPKEMAASFLQYCAMCEKQITTPCNSILYCSEACRRKDSAKPLSAATSLDMLPPPTSMPSSPIQPVLMPRAPTGTSASTAPIDTPSVRIPSQIHSFKSDLDPTEWKPKLHNRKESEAFRYLSQFHRSTSSMSIATAGSDAHHGFVPSSVPATPSLANTPITTTNSSLSTSSGGFGYNSTGHSFDFSVRPLPMRPNRWFSADGATPRGTDLVTPHIVPAVEVEDIAGDVGVDLWNKKVVVKGAGASKEGLGKLFGTA